MLFRLFRRVVARLLGTRAARLLWHLPGSRALYRRLIGMRPAEVTVDGHVMALDPLDSLLLSVNGDYEADERALFVAAIRPGDTVLDVGAHIGLYTLAAARAAGPTGRVIAFEPSSVNHALLVENVARNGYGNVEIRREAVGDRDGTVSLFLSVDNTGDHSLIEDDTRQGESVPLVRLDSLPIDTVAVIKMDIQGGEPAALRGAAALLARSPSVALFTEISDDHGVDGLAYRRQLAGAGFAVTAEIPAASGDHCDIVCVKGKARVTQAAARSGARRVVEQAEQEPDDSVALAGDRPDLGEVLRVRGAAQSEVGGVDI